MIIHGDCLEEMKKMEDNSISGIVTDPPYGLGFMNKEWDAGLPHDEIWKEALRIVKPGGHLLAFGGTRTYHRLTCAIEDAGWEVRDCLMFLYGSGFPKSHNFGCKCTGDAVPYSHEKKPESQTESSMRSVSETNLSSAISTGPANKETVFPGMQEQNLQSDWTVSSEGHEARKESCMERRNNIQEEQGELHRPKVCEMSIGISSDGEEGRICNGTPVDNGETFGSNSSEDRSSPSQGSQHAKQQRGKPGTVPGQQDSQNNRMAACEKCGRLKGWGQQGTALKPAYEPIIMAMKPCDGTFKQNAEKWGQAGINIDGCRIGIEERVNPQNQIAWQKWKEQDGRNHKEVENKPDRIVQGRWPANVMFDEEAAALLDEQSGFNPSRFFYCAKTSRKERNDGLEGMPQQPIRHEDRRPNSHDIFNTEGCGRNTDNKPQKNNHPTVKPLKLMRYLITLIMPPKDGILLDPFAGSGSTIIAAHQLGVKAIGIEKQAEYVEIANKRLEYYKNLKDEKEPDLFDQAQGI